MKNTTETEKKQNQSGSKNLIKNILEYSKHAESQVCTCLWKNPELYFQYDFLTEDHFTEACWKTLFQVGKNIVVGSNKACLDEITVSSHLSLFPELKENFIKLDCMATVQGAFGYVHEENLPGYLKDLEKYKGLKMYDISGMISEKLMKKWLTMSWEEIKEDAYRRLEKINHTVENNSDSEDCVDTDKLEETIEFYKNKDNHGFDLSDSLYLSPEICGIQKGHMYLLGMASGGGKSFLMNRWVLPGIIEKKERVCLIINEEDYKRVYAELLTYYANKKLKKHLSKKNMYKGKFDKETEEAIELAKEALKKDLNNTIYIVSLESYNVERAIAKIKKYAAMGVGYFILDTLKLGNNVKEDHTWLALQTDTVKLYDLIKPSNKNLCLLTTVQLGKQALNQRYLNNSSIGVSKNMVDVMSCCLLARLLHPDEKESSNSKLTCFRYGGVNNASEVKVDLNPNKNYIIIFITKNRFGSANNLQIIAEVDFNTNYYEEVGYARLPPEF